MQHKVWLLSLSLSLSFTISLLFTAGGTVKAQNPLYQHTFPLSSVRLLDGPFKHALELNVQVLLQYDVDRLLAPLLHEAGLPKKAEFFPNWQGLDGHIVGHYLSALAIHYAATGNEELRDRMEYVISEMRRVQIANGDGYIGGIPNGRRLWDSVRAGRITQGGGFDFQGAWVPWYNVHKTFAGLRDAWYYVGNELAKEMFLELCDWGIEVTSALTDQQMSIMLRTEYGGMNEVFADAYQMTGDERYLRAAKRFGNCFLFEPLTQRRDILDNLHANTQIPKAVGYQRIGEVSGDELHTIAGEFFWETVINHRTSVLGGNSRREHFPSRDDRISYMQAREGPETCNTYNMMRLAKGLFRVNPLAKYADYYERAMFNHILSTQHPVHGGYVYFTSMRPGHYRNYSAPNSAMWCCVGTGMENHGKYGEFIYTHRGDSLYVNLFVASELDWSEKGITLIQNTNFPFEESSRLTIKTERATPFTLMIRSPWWVQPGQMTISINGNDYPVDAEPSSYIAITREWENDDVVEIIMPMTITIEELPYEPNFIAILRGPIVLGARMGTHDLRGLVADDHRWAHIAHGALVSLFDTPAMIGTRQEVQAKLEAMEPVDGKPFHFTLPAGLFQDAQYDDLVLEPFFSLHDSRYMLYWLSITQQEYDQMFADQREAERQRVNLARLTVSFFQPGEMQPERDHNFRGVNSEVGESHGRTWRHATNGGSMTFELNVDPDNVNKLVLTYWGGDSGNRVFDILVDGIKIAEQRLNNNAPGRFFNVEHLLDDEAFRNKETITVTLQAHPGAIAGGIFGVRTVIVE